MTSLVEYMDLSIGHTLEITTDFSSNFLVGFLASNLHTALNTQIWTYRFLYRGIFRSLWLSNFQGGAVGHFTYEDLHPRLKILPQKYSKIFARTT